VTSILKKMKRSRLILFIPILLVIASCEKEKPETSYLFKNNSSDIMYDFSTYYWDGSDFLDEIYHGTLGVDEVTEKIKTHRPDIDFSFAFDPGGILYVSANPYTIIRNKRNTFIIDNNTSIYGGTTYYVLNSSLQTLYDLYTFYWDGSDFYDMVDHNNLYSGYRTEHVRTDRSYIYATFALSAYGDYYVTDAFSIEYNSINSIVINKYTDIYYYEAEGPVFKSTGFNFPEDSKKCRLMDILNN
jgi:hypothetical protein